MSKVGENELLKLSMPTANANEEESYSFTPLVGESWPSKIPPPMSTEEYAMNQRIDKKKVEKSTSAPTANSRIPSFRLSAHNNHGYTRVTYSNEKKAEEKKERHIGRPGHAAKKEQSTLFGRPKSPLKPSPQTATKDGKRGGFFSRQTDSATSKVTKLAPDGQNKGRISPHRGLRPPNKGGASPPRLMERPTQHHSFLTDAADVKQIEQGLLQLMDDFQIGNLRAFGKDSKLRQMEEIREQQEKLAKLHFDVGAEQDLYPPLSEDGLRISGENMRTLMEKLAQLSENIENLHTDSAVERRASGAMPSNSLHSEATTRKSNSAHPPISSETDSSPVLQTPVPQHSSPFPSRPTSHSMRNTSSRESSQTPTVTTTTTTLSNTSTTTTFTNTSTTTTLSNTSTTTTFTNTSTTTTFTNTSTTTTSAQPSGTAIATPLTANIGQLEETHIAPTATYQSKGVPTSTSTPASKKNSGGSRVDSSFKTVNANTVSKKVFDT